MKILLLRGNPRKTGYTQRFTELFKEGAQSAGADIVDISLQNIHMENCIGCYSCWTKSPGRCIHNDDVAEVLEQFVNCDMLLCATPLYYYSISALLKTFLERTFPAIRHGFAYSGKGILINKLRYPDKWGDKRLGYIVTGALRDHENFASAQKLFESLSEGLSLKLCAPIIRPESYLFQFELAKPKRIKEIESAFVQAGIETVQQGKVTEETLANCQRPLSPDDESFLMYSNVYWDYAISLGKEGTDLEKVRETVNNDVRILLNEMVKNYDPIATKRVKAVIQFDFTDNDMHFRVEINRGKVSLTQATSENCDLRITTETLTWANVFMRKISVRDALANREIRLEGDKYHFSKLERYFPPPA